MRLTALFAAAALAGLLSACNPAEPEKTEAAAEAPAAPAHDMAGMDPTMKSADTADDAATAETPDGHMFHTFPNKVETVHLPAGAWSAAVDEPTLVEVGAGKDEAMPDGTMHHVVKLTPKASGNAKVTFERPAAGGAPAQKRTVMVMVH